MESNLTETVGVPSAAQIEHSSPGVIDVSGRLVLLTWITFAIMAFVLYKVAWKPILNVLDLRERSIRNALEDAAKARAELAEVEVKSRQTLASAGASGQEIIAKARSSADELAAMIAEQARADAAKMKENAKREIGLEIEKARERLRAESASIALSLAGKIVGENIDAAKNKEFVEKMIGDIESNRSRGAQP